MKEHQENKNGQQSPAHPAPGINDKLIYNLRDVSHVMRSLYEGRGSQKHILIVLDEIGGPVTQRALTERLGIRPGSASEVIAKLESAGYIRRSPNETDQRTSDIIATEAGKEAAAEAKKNRRQRHEEMFSCLSEEEKNTLLSLLEKINGDWKERYHSVGQERGRCGRPHKGCGLGPHDHEHHHGPEGDGTHGGHHGPGHQDGFHGDGTCCGGHGDEHSREGE